MGNSAEKYGKNQYGETLPELRKRVRGVTFNGADADTRLRYWNAHSDSPNQAFRSLSEEFPSPTLKFPEQNKQIDSPPPPGAVKGPLLTPRRGEGLDGMVDYADVQPLVSKEAPKLDPNDIPWVLQMLYIRNVPLSAAPNMAAWSLLKLVQSSPVAAKDFVLQVAGRVYQKLQVEQEARYGDDGRSIDSILQGFADHFTEPGQEPLLPPDPEEPGEECSVEDTDPAKSGDGRGLPPPAVDDV